MANESLRHACADILDALAGAEPMSEAGDLRSMRLMDDAATLRHAELLQYGPPVPADEVQALVDEAVAEVEREWDHDNTADIDDATAEADIARGIAEREVEALRALVAPSKLARYDATTGRELRALRSTS